MQPGDKVIATAFRDRIIERVVAKVIENTVVICKVEEWESAKAENRDPVGVGFPIYAVKKINK